MTKRSNKVGNLPKKDADKLRDDKTGRDSKGRFQKGNVYYNLALGLSGRKQEYTPEEYIRLFQEYVYMATTTPLKEQKVLSNGTKVSLDKMRPLTIKGFCAFANISRQTFLNYEKRPEFIEIVSRMRDIMEDQMFTGAASGFFDSSIVARMLKLGDSIDENVNMNATIKIVSKSTGDATPKFAESEDEIED